MRSKLDANTLRILIQSIEEKTTAITTPWMELEGHFDAASKIDIRNREREMVIEIILNAIKEGTTNGEARPEAQTD